MPSIFNTNLLYPLDATPQPSKQQGAPAYYSLKFKIGAETERMFLNDGTLEAEYAKTLAKGAAITVAKDNKGKYTLMMPSADQALSPSPTPSFPQASPEDLERAKETRRQAQAEQAKEYAALYVAIRKRLSELGVDPGDLSSATATVFIQATRP